MPVFLKLSTKFDTIGYDINKKRIKELRRGVDRNLEFSKKDLKPKKNLKFTDKINFAKKCNFFIITVPTPILKNKKPDLSHIVSATKSIANIIKVNDIVFIESTIYPGVTEEISAPIIEKYKNFKLNKDFFIGYSSERINPGDSIHGIGKIPKVVAFDNNNRIIRDKILEVYRIWEHKNIMN